MFLPRMKRFVPNVLRRAPLLDWYSYHADPNLPTLAFGIFLTRLLRQFFRLERLIGI